MQKFLLFFSLRLQTCVIAHHYWPVFSEFARLLPDSQSGISCHHVIISHFTMSTAQEEAVTPLNNPATTDPSKDAADTHNTERKIAQTNDKPQAPANNTRSTEEIIAQTYDKTHEGRTITVALDLSERSRDAFAWTVANLYRAGDKLSLIHVTTGPDMFLPGGVDEDEKRESHKMLGTYAKYCLLHNIPHDARHFIGELGPVVDQLTTTQAEGSALVVGNHNKSSIASFFLGSSSESALHSAHVPVVVVKRPHKVSLNPDTKRRIGICVDYSIEARRAFDWMMNEMFREDDSVFVLYLSGSSKQDITVVDGAESGDGDALMDQYVHLLAERSADYHSVHSRTHKSLPEAAASFANSLDLDCLVVGSRGQGAVKRNLFGSFSDGLVRACKCNLVIVKS